MPVVALIVAYVAGVSDQVPGVMALVRVVVPPLWHTCNVPAIGGGAALTLTVSDAEQPVTGSVYMILAEPAVLPGVTTPVVAFTEAMPLALDDHVPVPGLLVSVVLKPLTHSAELPVIGAGRGLTVTTTLLLSDLLQLPSVAPVSA